MSTQQDYDNDCKFIDKYSKPIEPNIICNKSEKERIFKEYIFNDEKINILSQNIIEELPTIVSYYIPINKNKLLETLKNYKIVDIIKYITGPFIDYYDSPTGPGFSYESQRIEFDYDIIHFDYIDVFGNVYSGKANDRLNPHRIRNSNGNISGHFPYITQNEFNTAIYIEPFKNKIFSDNRMKSPNELSTLITNKKIEIFNNIKKDISTDIFNTTEKIIKIENSIKTSEYNLKDYRVGNNYSIIQESINKNNRELTKLTNKYKLPLSKLRYIEDIKNFLKSYVGEIKYEFFENDTFISSINIITYINKCIHDKQEKERLENEKIALEKKKIENERLAILQKKKEQKELLKKEKYNTMIQSLL